MDSNFAMSFHLVSEVRYFHVNLADTETPL